MTIILLLLLVWIILLYWKINSYITWQKEKHYISYKVENICVPTRNDFVKQELANYAFDGYELVQVIRIDSTISLLFFTKKKIKNFKE